MCYQVFLGGEVSAFNLISFTSREPLETAVGRLLV